MVRPATVPVEIGATGYPATMTQHAPADRLRPLLRTRQTREFTGAEVDPSALDALADVARWTGSSRNAQPWRFVVVTDRRVLGALADAGMPQTRALASAGAAIVIVTPSEPGRGISHAYDEGRAAERILVGASILGLGAGIAWVRSEARPTVAALLGLPEDRFARTIVAIGHPTEAGRRPKSAAGEARLPREATVFHDRWPR
jgi:nitroreductase